MADLVGGLHALQLRVLQDDLILEDVVDGDVDVLVDGRADPEPAVLAVVAGKVGSASAQGNAQR